MIKFVRCNPGTNSSYLVDGVVYTATSERRNYYLIKEFDNRSWHKDYFTVVSCPCDVKNCIKHRVRST